MQYVFVALFLRAESLLGTSEGALPLPGQLLATDLICYLVGIAYFTSGLAFGAG